jgi:hypothetical protein
MILRYSQAAQSTDVAALLDALRGPAPDIASLVEAHRLLRQIEKQRAGQAPTTQRVMSPDMPRKLNFNPKYGLAHLTGRLSRLGSHRIT